MKGDRSRLASRSSNKRKSANKDGMISCKNSVLGCQICVRPEEENEHLNICSYKFVNCEACGQRVLQRDLFTHQKYKKCYENLLRKEVVRSVRKTSAEVRTHQNRLLSESAHHEMKKKWEFRMRLHEQRGSTPRVPSAAECLTERQLSNVSRQGTTSSMSARSRPLTEHSNQGTLSRNSARTFLTEVDTINIQEVPRSTPVILKPGDDHEQDETGDVEYQINDGDSRMAAHLGEQEPTLTKMTARCRRCLRMFMVDSNHNRSCKWHKGPIVKVFGGTCQYCGRLDHMQGCMESAHEI